jgi:ribosomal protein S27AE
MFIRLIVPDTHGHLLDPDASQAFFTDVQSMAHNIREIVMLGDHLDCSAFFLAPHHTPTYTDECDGSFEDDVTAANLFLDRLQKLCPHAAITMLMGNHEDRLSKFACEATRRNGSDARFLSTLISPEAVMHLEQRGIRYIRRDKFYDDCAVPGTVRIAPDLWATHGTYHGRNAANTMMRQYGNVVFGHIHRLIEVSERTIQHGKQSAYCCGHLSRNQPLWKHSQPTSWETGYAVQICGGDGSWAHLNIPIENAQSHLQMLGSLLPS